MRCKRTWMPGWDGSMTSEAKVTSKRANRSKREAEFFRASEGKKLPMALLLRAKKRSGDICFSRPRTSRRRLNSRKVVQSSTRKTAPWKYEQFRKWRAARRTDREFGANCNCGAIDRFRCGGS